MENWRLVKFLSCESLDFTLDFNALTLKRSWRTFKGDSFLKIDFAHFFEAVNSKRK